MDLGNLSEEDFTKVVGVDISTKQAFVKGLKEPSSESFLHNEIYRQREDVNVVFHGHDELVMENNDKLNLPITEREESYGTMGLMLEVIKVLNNSDYILIKNHGFLSLGKTIEEAGKEALRQHYNAFKITESML